jgi:D-threo-aldose 1-dehydrogenase
MAGYRAVSMNVRRIPLGSTGVRVSEMIFGGAPIGGLYAPVSDDQAAAVLEAAWAAGIRAFDTAPHYGAGLSEQRLGRFLGGRPRDEFVLSTKVGRRLVPETGDVEGIDGFYGTPKLARVRDYSRDGALATLEASLRRLDTDRIDIALIHDPDDYAAEALDGAYAALDQLRSEGTIQAVGVGMNQAPLLEWFVERADLDCVLVAGRYSLLDTAAADGLFPACQLRGVAVLAAGVFNSGILADPRPGATYDYAPAAVGLIDRAQRIRTVCARYGVPIGAVAIQFVLRHPAVTAVVVGARNATEVTQNVSYLAAAVPPELFGDLAAERLIPDGA